MYKLRIDLCSYLVGNIKIFFQQTVSALRVAHALQTQRQNPGQLPIEGQDVNAIFALSHKHQEAPLTSGIGLACAKICEASTVSSMGFSGKGVQTGELKRTFQH